MDIMMPEMDGYETMAVIRENPRFRKLPIVSLTAKAMKATASDAWRRARRDYLAKPVQHRAAPCRLCGCGSIASGRRTCWNTSKSTYCWSTISRPS